MLSELSSFIEGSISTLLVNNPFWAIGLVFIIIFCETGLVITPFLPGDSLLFILGALVSSIHINLLFLFIILLSVAAILGNTVNYTIGRYVGEKVLSRGWIKKDYLLRTENFYRKYGAKTIIFSRFIPVIRTISPFVAGIGKMDSRKFMIFNFIGGFSWVIIFLIGGYFFGNIPLVKENLSLAMLFIILISIIPAIIHIIKSKS